MVPLMNAIKEVDGKLTAEKMEHLTTRKASTLGQEQAEALASLPPGIPTTLSDLQTRFGTMPLVQMRMKLENYLLVPRGATERQYIVDRLEGLFLGASVHLKNLLLVLANDVDLGPYTWDGGSTDTGSKRWTAELPSDAEVFTLFVTDHLISVDPVPCILLLHGRENARLGRLSIGASIYESVCDHG